jgi:hypothetical protein
LTTPHHVISLKRKEKKTIKTYPTDGWEKIDIVTNIERFSLFILRVFAAMCRVDYRFPSALITSYQIGDRGYLFIFQYI